MSLGYLLDALLGLASEIPKYSAHRTLLWQIIVKNRKRRRITYSSENSISESTAIAQSGMLDRGLVSEQQWSRGVESILPPLPTQCWLVYQRMVHLQRCQQ